MADNWYYTLTLCIFFSYKCQINQIHLNLVTINILLFLNYYYYFNHFSSCIVTLIFPPLSICPLGGLCILVAQWDYIRMALFILCPAIQSDSVSHPVWLPLLFVLPPWNPPWKVSFANKRRAAGKSVRILDTQMQWQYTSWSSACTSGPVWPQLPTCPSLILCIKQSSFFPFSLIWSQCRLSDGN